jgi:hypothetical protein
MLELNRKVKINWEQSLLDPYDAVRRFQVQCSAVQCVWNFFREKLLLRLDPRFGGYLTAADAYAWACYQPLMEDRKSKGDARTYREPPLVTFNSDVSPWSLSRQSRYDVEGDETGATQEDLFRRVYESLPIPIIGIPWQSEGFLPGMAALAHETGHVVDHDFRMNAVVASKVAAATARSKLAPAWSDHWWKEVFADLFACWVAGPSFVWALANAVPESPNVVALKKRPSGGDPKTWGKYPPGTLRILLNLAALEWLDFPMDAGKIRKYWMDDYPKDAMCEFAGDAGVVVKTVYEYARIPQRLRYPATQENFVFASVFTGNGKIPDGQQYDGRAVVGAASRASRELADAAKLERGCRYLTEFMAKRPPGQLAGEGSGPLQDLKTDELLDLLIEPAVSPEE